MNLLRLVIDWVGLTTIGTAVCIRSLKDPYIQLSLHIAVSRTNNNSDEERIGNEFCSRLKQKEPI